MLLPTIHQPIALFADCFLNVCSINGSLRYQKRMRNSDYGRASLWALVCLGGLNSHGK